MFLDKRNSATIGFVVSCVFAGAINTKELQSWADHVLMVTDASPPYIVDLSTFNEPPPNLFRVIGFVPHSGLSDAEKEALVGVAFLRGRERFEPIPGREQALTALARHPHVLARFRETFPFITLPATGTA